jgi:DNA-binding NarL/FixJ family response regulator
MARSLEQPAHRAETLVAREREHEQLYAALERARNDEIGIVLISGEPGIGKTRLVRSFQDELASKTTAIDARCLPGSASPLTAVLSALQTSALHNPPGWQEAVEQTDLDDLLNGQIGSAEHSGVEESPDVRRIVDRITVLIQLLAEHQTVVVSFDDAQWASEPELDLVRLLLRSPRRLPILILLSYRDTEVDPRSALQQLIRDAYRETTVERLSLARLGEHGARQLIGAVLDSPAHAVSRPLAQAIQREAEGVPFFIEELVLHLHESGSLKRDGKVWSLTGTAEIEIPQSIHGVVTSRVLSLSEPAQETLTIGAIYGRIFPVDLVIAVAARLGDHSRDEITQHLNDALTRCLIVEHESGSARDRFAFAHDQIRDALVRDLNAIRRRLLHQAVAETLEETGNPADPGHDAALAHHFGSGEDIRKASLYAERAGERDSQLGAYRQAITHFTAALDALTYGRNTDIADDPEREMRLLSRRQAAYSEIGATDLQQRDIQRWNELATRQGHDEQRFLSTDAITQFAIAQGDHAGARQSASELQLLAADDTRLQRMALIRTGETRTGRLIGDPSRITATEEDLREALQAFMDAMALDTGELRPAIEMEIGMIEWELAGEADRHRRGEARSRISTALEQYRDRGDDRGEITALIALAYRRQLSSRESTQGTPFVSFLEEIRRLRGEERLLIRESDRARNHARAALAVHVHCREFGMPRRAIEAGHDALNWAEVAGDRRIMFHALGGLSQAEIWLGQTDHALDFAERAMALVESGTPQISRQQALIWLGTASAVAGHPSRAMELLREAVDLDEAPTPGPSTLDAMVRLAEVLAGTCDPGDQDEAVALVEIVQRSTDGRPGKLPWGVEARRIQSLIHEQNGDLDDALTSAKAAMAHLSARTITQRRHTLATQLQAARTLILCDRIDDARPVLESAVQAAHAMLADIADLGMRAHAEHHAPMLAEIKQLAFQHNLWPEQESTRTPQARPGGLSRREIEILQLVAIGKTNRTIADELFISEKTVARHLTNIYTKIGTESRTQAAAWAYQNAIA